MPKRIGLIQLDGTLPNLALMKLGTWYKNKKDDVVVIRKKMDSAGLIPFDKVYISCIFDKNKKDALNLAKQFKNVEIGGIGTDRTNRLPEEIEHLMPNYELFNCDYSLGFTTRGCIRKCGFCKVPEHEGKIKVNCDIYEFWDRRHKEIIILDNNILALPEHFKKIAEQIKKENLIVDFNQGLDHRLLTPEICDILLGLRHKREIRFAFDHVAYKPTVEKALKMLRNAGLKDWKTRWYIYVSPTDTFETVYERMEFLRVEKQAVYVMRDEKIAKEPIFVALASWGNMMGAFKMDLKEVLQKSKRLKTYAKHFKKIFPNEGEKSATALTEWF